MVKDLWHSTSNSAALDAKPEYPDYESMIRAEELRTPTDTKILHEPSSSTDKNVVNLIFHLACIEISAQPA